MPKFTDVPKSHWCYDDIELLAQMKAIGGYPDGSFIPDKTVTRAEVVSFLRKWRSRQSEMVKALAPAVVTIKTEAVNGLKTLGSGVVLDKEGHIATNCHVAMNGFDPWKSLAVFFDNLPTPVEAVVRRGDFGQDIAIIRVQAAPGLLQPVTFATNPVEWFDEVYCIGNPMGYTDTGTMGRVSCAKRVIGGTEWIQTDAAINPGNSGGGAFNFLGELIGLSTWILTYSDEAKTAPINNMGFITPSYKVKEMYELTKVQKASLVTQGTPISFMTAL